MGGGDRQTDGGIGDAADPRRAVKGGRKRARNASASAGKTARFFIRARLQASNWARPVSDARSVLDVRNQRRDKMKHRVCVAQLPSPWLQPVYCVCGGQSTLEMTVTRGVAPNTGDIVHLFVLDSESPFRKYKQQ